MQDSNNTVIADICVSTLHYLFFLARRLPKLLLFYDIWLKLLLFSYTNTLVHLFLLATAFYVYITLDCRQ